MSEGITIESLLYVQRYAQQRMHDDRQPDWQRGAWHDVSLRLGEEIDRLRMLECAECRQEGMKPSHRGSSHCESGSIASGGIKAHCTCDVCF
jgi:hypothetical protein